MPTVRPRHAITESDSITAAIDDAAKRWPADRENRARLLVHLIDEGHRSISVEHRRRVRANVKAVDQTHGALAGVFGPNYLGELREDWPE